MERGFSPAQRSLCIAFFYIVLTVSISQVTVAMAACAEGIMPLEHDIIDKFPTQCDFGGYPSFDDAELPNQNNRTAEKISNTPPRQQEHRRLKRIKHEDVDIPRSSASDEGPSPCDSFRLAWLTKFANLMTTWLHSLAHHHQNCRAIPANVVVRITICIFEYVSFDYICLLPIAFCYSPAGFRILDH